MRVKVDDVAVKVGVFDSQRRFRYLFAILDDFGVNQLASPTLAVVLCIENEVNVLFFSCEFRKP